MAGMMNYKCTFVIVLSLAVLLALLAYPLYIIFKLFMFSQLKKENFKESSLDTKCYTDTEAMNTQKTLLNTKNIFCKRSQCSAFDLLGDKGACECTLCDNCIWDDKTETCRKLESWEDQSTKEANLLSHLDKKNAGLPVPTVSEYVPYQFSDADWESSSSSSSSWW